MTSSIDQLLVPIKPKERADNTTIHIGLVLSGELYVT